MRSSVESNSICIKFDEERLYNVGDELSGVAILTCKRPLFCTSIDILFSCVEIIKFNSQVKNDQEIENICYHQTIILSNEGTLVY